MAIDLTKGQRVDLGLQKAGIGLGWAANEGSGYEFDLDASAFLLGANGKIPSDEHFVFYNNLKSPDGSVESSGDEKEGGSGGDDETLTVDIPKIGPKVEEIIIVVTIHDAETRRQNFGQVRNSYIRIYDASVGEDEEICKYELDEDFSIETAVEFGRLYKRNGAWKFEAVGRGFQGGLQYFVNKYA